MSYIDAAMASFLVEYVIPQLQTCTALVLSGADCNKSSCSSSIG